MKKLYTSILFVLFLSVSCKKESINPSLKELLLGNWNYQKLVNSSYRSDGALIEELTTPISSSDYGYIFYDDGTVSQRFGGGPSKFSYKIISDTEFEVNTGSVNLCKVISVNDNNIIFVIGGPKQTGSNYTTSTHYLSR